MEKKTAGLLGAIVGLTTMGSAHAAINPGLILPAPASSYAELLTPIPNAVALLKASDFEHGQPAAHIELVQYYGNSHHHHQVYRHSHHHHHHNGVTIGLPGFRHD